MGTKRVLIVDDDKDILRMLEFSLRRLSQGDFQISTIANSLDALQAVEKEEFDLIVADYMMPGMTGIDLARAVRRISPDTQIILMTAYGTDKRLRETSQYLGLDGYLDKPFTAEEIYEVVSHQEPETDTTSPEQYLEALKTQTGVRCVLLLDQNGTAASVIGEIDEMELESIGAFVAANFRATAELVQKVGNRAAFNSSFHEGETYNIYAYYVNDRFSLAVVYESRLKPGVVWFYTRQAAGKLADKLGG